MQRKGFSMKLTHGLAALVLLASATAANAEVTGTLTAVSDYNWRGVSQTAMDPALQGSIDYAHDSGFYAGVWASNVDFGDCCDESIETDLYFGFSGGEAFTWDVGFVYYVYPGADDLDFPEIYASLGWEWLTGKVSYSNDFANSGDSSIYLEANGEWGLPANFGLTAHVGYSDGDGIEWAYGQDNYFDWSVGVTYALGHFDFGLSYVDGSDLKTLDGTPDDVGSSESTVIFSVSTSFPWSDE
jgi:uncharacterized protein (TIGR02001 family)